MAPGSLSVLKEAWGRQGWEGITRVPFPSEEHPGGSDVFSSLFPQFLLLLGSLKFRPDRYPLSIAGHRVLCGGLWGDTLTGM